MRRERKLRYRRREARRRQLEKYGAEAMYLKARAYRIKRQEQLRQQRQRQQRQIDPVAVEKKLRKKKLLAIEKTIDQVVKANHKNRSRLMDRTINDVVKSLRAETVCEAEQAVLRRLTADGLTESDVPPILDRRRKVTKISTIGSQDPEIPKNGSSQERAESSFPRKKEILDAEALLVPQNNSPDDQLNFSRNIKVEAEVGGNPDESFFGLDLKPERAPSSFEKPISGTVPVPKPVTLITNTGDQVVFHGGPVVLLRCRRLPQMNNRFAENTVTQKRGVSEETEMDQVNFLEPKTENGN